MHPHDTGVEVVAVKREISTPVPTRFEVGCIVE